MRSAACLLSALMILCSSTGCYAWSRQPLPVAEPAAFRQYQVWTRDSMMILQKVRVEHDTLFGVPADASRDCGACTVTIPVRVVDSLRSGTTEHLGTALLGVGAGATGALVLLMILLSGSTD
jgi:hypothetical protein